MADIIEPMGGWASHDEIYEFYNVGSGDDSNVTMDFSFSYTLDPTEEFVSCVLTSSPDVTEYGSVLNGLRVTGHIKDFFERQGINLPLSLRNRQTLGISVVNGFDSLPTDKSVDVVKFAPPAPPTGTITYTVTLTYDDITIPLLPVRNTSTKTFTQTVRGSYASWASKLQEYISNTGPYPDVEI
jgi:hypothetical protein